MPQAVACPKCKTKYSLPDELLGKPVKCKSCGAMFQVNPPTTAVAKRPTPSRQVVQRAPAGPQASPAELAKLGLDGPIQQQPDLFGEVPHPQAGNPLGNHVVHDPGFAQIEVEEPEEEVDNDISAMFQNPALAPTPKKKKKDPLAGEGKTKKKGKKKKSKKKMHEGTRDTLNQATMIMIIIGMLTIVINVFGYINAKSEFETLFGDEMAAELDPGEEEGGFLDDTDLLTILKVFYGIGIGVGVVFCILGVGVQFFPITCTLLSIILYVSTQIIFLILNPLGLLSMAGWVIRIIIIGSLGKAFMDALNARWFEQAQRARSA